MNNIKSSGRLPVVAIVGRPNVGKSSLFNLMINERKSIVDEMEGVTRDINIGEAITSRMKFILYDTAGYLEKGDRFNKLTQEKVKQAIGAADLILFMVDGRNFHPLDEELALFLKRQNRKVFVLANKLDNRKMAQSVYEFHVLGFETVIPFSVLQKRGLTSVIETIEDFFESHKTDEEEAIDEIKIALVGKPNVGKSMLLNTMLGFERSIVSEVPGTTRDSIDDVLLWKNKRIRLIDTAGLRRKSKIKEDIEYYSNVRTAQAIENADIVIQLLDASEPVSNQDKKVASLTLEKGRGLVFAFNKWDLEKPDTAEDNYDKMREFVKDLRKELPEFNYIPVEFISAKDKYKISKLMDTVFKVFDDFNYRVPTARLNDWLIAQVRESNLDRPRSQLRVYYVTQIFTSPPRFVFFINHKKYLRKDFPRFLENRLRLAFEFTGVPIRVNFREKEKRDGQKK